MPKKKPAHQSWQQLSLTPFNGVDCFRTSFGFQLNQHTKIEQFTIQRSISLKKKFWNGGAIVGLEIDSLAVVATSPRRYGFFHTSAGNQLTHVEHQSIGWTSSKIQSRSRTSMIHQMMKIPARIVTHYHELFSCVGYAFWTSTLSLNLFDIQQYDFSWSYE